MSGEKRYGLFLDFLSQSLSFGRYTYPDTQSFWHIFTGFLEVFCFRIF
jgi:hypothetical protein